MQHYIKCPKCKELIAVKSEFMVLCPHCNKKLSNSFREWNSQKANGTFEQYLSEVCVSEIAISGLKDQRKITRKIGISRNLRRTIVATSVAIAVVACVVCGTYLYRESQKGASIKAILNDSWKLSYYEDLGVTMKFPFELEAVKISQDSLNVTDSTLVILQEATRSWKREGVAAVNVLRMDFAPAFGINREGATQGILEGLVQNNDMKAMEYIPSDYSMGNGIKARMFSGSFLVKAEAYQFRAVMVVKKNSVWYFMVTYLRSTPEGSLLAEKFFNGILI